MSKCKLESTPKGVTREKEEILYGSPGSSKIAKWQILQLLKEATINYHCAGIIKIPGWVAESHHLQ